MIRLPALASALLVALVTIPAQAATWRVDVLVFRYLRATEESGVSPTAPSVIGAIELDDEAALSAAGITLLPESEFALEEQWGHLRRSPQFRPLLRLAWTQNDPPKANGPRLHLKSGELLKIAAEEGFGEREFSEVDGTLALSLGRYLHLDADLVYTVAGEEAASWRLEESRRMRSEELHHLDSPRLGVLAVIKRWVP